MSQEDQSPLSPSLHHSDSIPNIFSQINEYARLESLPRKTCSAQGSAQKSVEGSTIRNSVISNLQHVLNLSNIGGRSECIQGTALPADSNCWLKPQLRLTDRDHENNQILSDGGLNLSIMSDDFEVPVKKPKLSPPLGTEMGQYNFLYQNDRRRDMKAFQVLHREHLTELFFLQNGGNLMDYFSWMRRPNNLLACYLFSEKLDSEDISPDMEISRLDSCPSSTPNAFQPSSQKLSDHMSSSFSGLAGFSITSPCSENTLLSYSQSTQDMALISTSTPTSTRPKMVKDWTPLSTGANTSFFNSSPAASQASMSSELSSSAVVAAYETSQEAIAELAKQEAQVMEKIMELRKKGLWSVRRIAKAAEPTHAKAHWDYVMEEMQWLAADFGQERKAKKAGSRKIARMVVRHFQDQQQKEIKAEKEDALKLKRIASNLAKCVKEFWTNIEKVVQYKQQSRLEEKRRKALDMHLSFIVDQTEKYSTWLTEGLGASLAAGGLSSQPTSANSVASSESNIDEDFKPNQDSDDDEETIEKEEQDLDVDKTAEEVAALQKEGEMSFEEFLQTLPKEVLNSATGGDVDKPAKEVEAQDGVTHSDADSYAPTEDSTDDEETLEEQEKQETVNHSEELLDLQKEGEMPIEELLKMYQGMHDQKPDELTDDSDKVTESSDVKDEDEEEGVKEEEEGVKEEEESNDKDSDVGTEFLIKQEKGVRPREEEVDKSGPGQEISDIAATAMSIQPTGYTLETAHVKTAVPFLLKHCLREYQHVGLDWLATMYEQRLNGILADEMGLGKTIQTIALLGFLACEKGIWGPHLIVVPTSVMLNWEMEIKKWCPAFKILTYYGSLKERKAKRQGWTKTNAFHVCITSYKLVIQDHQAFRRKKWKYFILDEAQNIKNFKSQRWQTLLNFHSQRRLLLTGTPLQNNLMELWSLMHFLMPHVFASHREFKEWFSNPLTGMIEGSMEYNESLVKRLHKVLRPFLLRRLKQDVEKQMPKKYEHVVMCRLSKRQRFLYDDFMAQAKTKETLATGHFMSVINILMQLRKVCNHPNLFDPRPIVSPFHMEGITLHFPSLAARALEKNPFSSLDFADIHPNFCDLEVSLSSISAKRIGELRTKRPLIVEIDSIPDPPPRLEPLPDGTQLVVTFPSESDDPPSAVQSTQASSSLGPETPIGSAAVQFHMDAEEQITEKDIVVAEKEKRSPLYLPSLELKRKAARKAKLEAIHRYNERQCTYSPVYGRELLDAVDCMKTRDQSFSDVGYVQCLNSRNQHKSRDRSLVWESTRHLAEIILTPQQYLSKLEDLLHRFVFVIPPATAPRSVMHLSHPAPSVRNQQMMEEFLLQKEFSPRMNCLHNIIKNQRVQFPELRLIQYDCGKLQTMDILLRRLKTGGHRALVFTQMTRMLDVLEAFLNFHGHRYLRLDGTTKVEQRQALMERFNMDPRIFCFILSTRSGGIGVNLTGADTVIFYDSDWNPTMDAQAQDRCHRIGQTRDVHIYRLISEKTVEENILKKANEKRLLGNVAIEGGNFTTAFFKQQTIKDLFEEPSGLESLVTDDNKNTADETPAAAENGGLNEELIEQALCAAEDETDMQAVKVARAEQKAELAEFDETQPWDEVKTDQDVKKENDDPSSNVEIELALLEKDLTPVERYAVSFMELQLAPITNEELMKAEEEVGLAKEEWELSHLKALKEEEERRAELEEDEMLYTSLHYTAWKQQPKLKELDESFDEMPVQRKYKGVGRPSNEMRLERRNLNGMKRSASPEDGWEDNFSTNILDDSIMSSSSISTNSSLIHANNTSLAAKLKKTSSSSSKRPKVVTSLVIKVVKKNSSGKSSQSMTPCSTPRPVKEPKKRLVKPPKRSLEDELGGVLPKKKRKKKELIDPDMTDTSPSSVTTTTLTPRAVSATAMMTPPKSRPMSVTKLLDSKRYLTSHGQRIIVQRVGNDVTATVSSPSPPQKLTPTPVTVTREQFESRPIPILEKLSATVMTSPVSNPLNPCRPSAVKSSIATTTVFPSHLHVSRLNQIVSSIAQNTIQNVTLAQSTPGPTIQYFLRPGGVVSGGIRTENLVIANSGVQQATIGHSTQGTSFVLMPQGLGKSSRFIMPTVTSQANKQSVLILPNAGKQNYIVAQQSGNRPGYILIPNNATQQNFILTAAASSGGVLPASQISASSVVTNISATSPKVVSSFPLLQTQQVQVARQLVSPAGLNISPQQSIPVVQAGISNTVPILEKLAMQLSGANVIGLSQQQQQYRTRIVPTSTIVQPSPKQSEFMRLGQSVGNVISVRQSGGSTVMGQMPVGMSVARHTTGPAPAGKMGGGIVTKQVAKQPSVSLLSGNSQSSTGSLVSRLPSGHSSGLVLAGKPIQPVNVAQFIVNQPRSQHISVDKLTQFSLNGQQLVLVDGRHGHELVTRGPAGPANTTTPKK